MLCGRGFSRSEAEATRFRRKNHKLSKPKWMANYIDANAMAGNCKEININRNVASDKHREVERQRIIDSGDAFRAAPVHPRAV
jgi:hypothetical protein